MDYSDHQQFHIFVSSIRIFLLTSWAKYICGTHYYISNRPEIPGAFLGLGPRHCMTIQAYLLYWVYLIAVIYQGYIFKAKNGDCQAWDWSCINCLNFCYRLAHNQMWLIEPDAPTMTLGKYHNQNDEVPNGLLSGSYKFRKTERSSSVCFTLNGDDWLISASTKLNRKQGGYFLFTPLTGSSLT